jgi:hypothetical protein
MLLEMITIIEAIRSNHLASKRSYKYVSPGDIAKSISFLKKIISLDTEITDESHHFNLPGN